MGECIFLTAFAQYLIGEVPIVLILMVFFPTSTPELPLLRTRLVLLVLSQVLFVVSGSLCLKVFTRHRDIQHLINDSVPDGVSVKLEYTDLKNATIVLFIITHLSTAFLSKILIFHLQDIYDIIPLSIAKKLRIVNKRLASTTFGYQTIGLSVLAVLNAISMGFFTSITFTRTQSITVTVDAAADNVRLSDSFGAQLLDRLGIPLAYRDEEYIRRTAILPWVAVLFTLPTIVVTAVAWRRRRVNLTLTLPHVDVELSDKDNQLPSGGNLDDKKAEIEETIEAV